MKYTKLTPNLVVRDVEAAVSFYQSVLGFQRGMSVPDNPPYVFASVTNGAGVEIFFNDQKAVGEDYPPLANRSSGRHAHAFPRMRGDRRNPRRREESGRENHHASEDTVLWHAGIRVSGSGRLDCHHGRAGQINFKYNFKCFAPEKKGRFPLSGRPCFYGSEFFPGA